jgi:hypothetical protein
MKMPLAAQLRVVIHHCLGDLRRHTGVGSGGVAAGRRLAVVTARALPVASGRFAAHTTSETRIGDAQRFVRSDQHLAEEAGVSRAAVAAVRRAILFGEVEWSDEENNTPTP